MKLNQHDLVVLSWYWIFIGAISVSIYQGWTKKLSFPEPVVIRVEVVDHYWRLFHLYGLTLTFRNDAFCFIGLPEGSYLFHWGLFAHVQVVAIADVWWLNNFRGALHLFYCSFELFLMHSFRRYFSVFSGHFWWWQVVRLIFATWYFLWGCNLDHLPMLIQGWNCLWKLFVLNWLFIDDGNLFLFVCFRIVWILLFWLFLRVDIEMNSFFSTDSLKFDIWRFTVYFWWWWWVLVLDEVDFRGHHWACLGWYIGLSPGMFIWCVVVLMIEAISTSWVKLLLTFGCF